MVTTYFYYNTATALQPGMENVFKKTLLNKTKQKTKIVNKTKI